MTKDVFICRTHDVSKEKPFVYHLNSREQLVVFQTADGYFALENRCPHAGAFLNEGLVSGNILTCIWHGWRFDLETGQSLNEYWARVKTYPLKIIRKKIYLQEYLED